jgi:hypothetical protein
MGTAVVDGKRVPASPIIALSLDNGPLPSTTLPFVIPRACDFIAFLVLGMLEWFCSLGAIDVYRNRVSRVQSADWLLVSGNAVVCPVGPFLCWFSARMMD